jgi:DNA repair exonuclease SbcCD ATPase subunit
MTTPVVTMNKQKKQLVPVKGGAPASAATMLPTLWAGRGYEDFDDFERLGDKLRRQAESIEKMIEHLEERIRNHSVTQKLINGIQESLDWLSPRFEEFEEYQKMWDYWDRDELYEKLKKQRCNHKGVWVSRAIRSEIVGYQFAGVLGHSNFNPVSDEAGAIFTTCVIEAIKAARPSALALESACREIRGDVKYIKYPPKTPEWRTFLAKHEDAWGDRHPECIDLQGLKDRPQKLIEKAKQALIVQEEKARAAKIEAEAEAARREAERLAAAEAEAGRQKVEEARRNAELEEQAARRAAEAKAEAERKREMEEAIAQCVYNTGGTDALNSSSTLEGLLEINYAQFCEAESCLVAYALGVFEMRRDLCAWRRVWEHNKFGLPIWQ